MMIKRSAVSLLVLLFSIASPIQAYQFYQLSDSPVESHSSRVASDHWDNTVVAWVEEGVGVWTRAWRDGELHDPIFHGPGELPDVSVTGHSGFALAWVHDGAIHLSEGNGLDWTEVIVYAQDAAQLTMPRLTGFVSNQWVHGAYLCWQNSLSEIYFARRHAGDWQDPEYVMPLDGWMGFAQAVPGPPDDPWQPRVFAMLEAGLVSSQRSEAGWDEPVLIEPEGMPYGGEFDMGGGGNHPAQLLSNGLQPTCPCNIIRFSQELPGSGWMEPEDLTFYFDEYTWPMDPAIEVGPDGRVHLFWYQEHYDMMMEFSHEGAFYLVLDDGEWSDETATLEDHVGKDTDMDIGAYHPSFTWAEGLDGAREIWLAIQPSATGIPSVPRPELVLAAYPNPFNPRVDLRFNLPHATDLQLDIVDMNGRWLARLAQGEYAAGERHFIWDGRDDAGRELASGVYMAKLRTEIGDATLKLLMLR